jgi:hypothetical protein
MAQAGRLRTLANSAPSDIAVTSGRMLSYKHSDKLRWMPPKRGTSTCVVRLQQRVEAEATAQVLGA